MRLDGLSEASEDEKAEIWHREAESSAKPPKPPKQLTLTPIRGEVERVTPIQFHVSIQPFSLHTILHFTSLPLRPLDSSSFLFTPVGVAPRDTICNVEASRVS